MRVSRCTRWAVAAAGLTAGQYVMVPVIHAQAAPVAASAPAVAPPPTVCGSTPNCAEANDFAVMITNFRTSDLRGYKMLDVVVRFRNKTANPLVLGYVQGSGGAVDEKGNRYSVYGGNGVRGIGQVSGNSFDPKFTLPAGGVGDAQFELAWYPGQQIYGFTFMLDLTVDEINSYEGNQHSLGGEFPLHFEGLTNGVSSGAALAAGSVVPGVASPCNKVGGVAGTAMSVAGASGGAVSNAAGQAATTAATVSSVASLFHHKKAAPAGTQPVDPCASAAPASVAQTAPTAAQSVPATSPAPISVTSTAAGAIVSKNPATAAIGQTAATVKAPVTAATPATAAVATGTPPGYTRDASSAKAPVITPVKPVVAAAPSKKTDTTVHKP
jgi:hypothetical protein